MKELERKELERIKEYFGDLFPDDVNKEFENLIDSKVKEQHKKINDLKKDLIKSSVNLNLSDLNTYLKINKNLEVSTN
ncbi:hypothetical protein [Aquimarina agarivorans]|uniref:hypothetical protein n=1 Tax=Aquimarina agarivorans TaxID=980584 RepID=UPI000248FABA|nr:hypothetical protein [Aquimarina agarivorans]